MDPSTKAQFFEQGGKIVGDLFRMAFNRPVKKKALTADEKDYPQQTEALQKLGQYTVVDLHKDGDVTVKSQGKLYVVTTAGSVFEQQSPVPSVPNPQRIHPIHVKEVEQSEPAAMPALPDTPSQKYSNGPKIKMPTREETSRELKRRLARELYKAELDLAAGLLIAGKPCDCLDVKHSLEIEATAEEMISQEPDNPVYREIVQWLKDNLDKVSVQAIESGQFKEEYPTMASQFKDFRKRVMGTAAFSAMKPSGTSLTLEDAKKMAAEAAAQEVERQWGSVEKK